MVLPADIEAAIGSQWIRVASPEDTHFHRMLLLHVHSGEAQAIALAADLKADVVLIDEHEGRELASEAGLSVRGILGVLLKAKHNGHIPAVKPEIQTLRVKARFFLSQALEAAILSSAGE